MKKTGVMAETMTGERERENATRKLVFYSLHTRLFCSSMPEIHSFL